MGLFNFARTATNNAAADTSAAPAFIELALNEESITIDAARAEGKTVAELFSLYGSDLGDVDRISRFVCAGRIVDGASKPEPGMVYRGAVASESKG